MLQNDCKKIDERTFEFALLIIDLYKFLMSKNEYVISKQILRSGTSIGANVHEAQAAQSKKDFVSKMTIVHPVKSKEVTFNRARRSQRNRLLVKTARQSRVFI